MSTFIAHRYHDICMGHRVVGHEGKCKNLHGHNYRFYFNVKPIVTLDTLGRVVDFSVIKSALCNWLEENWDHKMMLWEADPMLTYIRALDGTVISVPFNPTAESIADYFLNKVAPYLLREHFVYLQSVTLEETRKCSVTVELERDVNSNELQNSAAIVDKIPVSYFDNQKPLTREEFYELPF